MKPATAGWMIIVILVFWIAFCAGMTWGVSHTRATATEEGAAVWQIDPVTGDKTFTWVTNEEYND